jgi:hypothetical protein
VDDEGERGHAEADFTLPGSLALVLSLSS